MKRFSAFLLILTTLVLCRFAAPAAMAADDPLIASGYYGVDREQGLLGQVAPGTSAEAVTSRVLAAGELTLTDGVKTGSSVCLAADGVKTDSLTLVVQADCNGDGNFSITDMLMIKSLLLKQQEFTAAQSAAGDVSGDGSVTITDFLQMKSKLLGLGDFTLRPIYGSQVLDGILMIPGETVSFGPAAAPEESTDPTEAPAVPAESVTVEGDAVVWENGTVTALMPGTARLTWGEEVLVITVCEEALQISLSDTLLVLDPKSSARLSPRLNHPVSASITYTVSDPAVAQVDGDGLVTALSEGSATITATLPNGASASREVRVLPMVKQIVFEKELVKVKNGSTRALVHTISPADSTEELIWSSSDETIATVDEHGVVTGLKNGTVTITCTSRYSNVQASCSVKVCNLIQVALTFDDGPSSAYTGKVLDMLKKYDINATFFLVGNRIAGCEKLLQRMVDEGHEIGYHTWAHSYFYNMSIGQMESDFEKFQKAVEKACGGAATVYRAPGGGITDNALKTIPLPHIMWTVDTRDWETRDTYRVRTAILNGLFDGAIILLHDIHGTTYTGTLAALQDIFGSDMDIEFMTITELLSRKGVAPESGKTYYRG